jgi:outer membrane protein assembly factor BamB
VLGAASAALLLGAESWPQYRGPAGLGISPVSKLPAEFGPENNLIWKTALPDGHSSPVLTETRIFLNAVEDERLYTICLDRENGEILWKAEVPRPRREEFNRVTNAAATTPVTDGENVYAFFGDFGLISFDAGGKERWRQPLGPFDNRNGHGSSPILVDGMLILICDSDRNSYVLALDKDTGQPVWKADRPEITRGYGTPAVYRPANGPAELIVPGAYIVMSYGLATGKPLWWVTGMAWQLKAVPIIDGDTIYINAWESGGLANLKERIPAFDEVLATNDADKDGYISPSEHPTESLRNLGPAWEDYDLDDDGRMDRRDWMFMTARRSADVLFFAIRPEGRRGDLTDQILWKYQKALPNTPSPLLYKGVFYLVKDGGILTTIDPKSGDVLKQDRLRDAIAKYWASPVAADRKVFMISEDCKVSVLDAAGEWTVLATNQLEGTCFASPAIADNRLYVRTSTALYSFGE